MPQEQLLLPAIQRAYGSFAQTPNMSGFQDVFTKDSERKREEFKTAAQIGADLDAESYKQIEGKIKGMLDMAKRGEVPVGGSEWIGMMEENAAAASQLKEAKEVRKEMEQQFLNAPDQMVFMEQAPNGEMIDTGYDGFVAAQSRLMAEDYENPYELVQKQSELLQQAQKLPMGVQAGIRELRDAASQVSNQLLGAGDAAETKAIRTPGGTIINMRTAARSEDAEAAIASLYDQYSPYLAAQWSRAGGSSGTGQSQEEFIDESIRGMLQMEESRQQFVRDFPPPRTGGSGSRRTPRTENFRRDVKEAIEQSDPEKVVQYVSGKGWNVDTVFEDGRPFFQFYQRGQTKDGSETRQKITNVPMTERGLAEFIISNSDQVDRETLDETQELGIDQSLAARSQRGVELRTVAKDVRERVADRWAGQTATSARRSMINSIIETYGLEGVEFKTFTDRVIVDGKVYKGAEGIADALSRKILSLQEEQTSITPRPKAEGL